MKKTNPPHIVYYDLPFISTVYRRLPQLWHFVSTNLRQEKPKTQQIRANDSLALLSRETFPTAGSRQDDPWPTDLPLFFAVFFCSVVVARQQRGGAPVWREREKVCREHVLNIDTQVRPREPWVWASVSVSPLVASIMDETGRAKTCQSPVNTIYICVCVCLCACLCVCVCLCACQCVRVCVYSTAKIIWHLTRVQM